MLSLGHEYTFETSWTNFLSSLDTWHTALQKLICIALSALESKENRPDSRREGPH